MKNQPEWRFPPPFSEHCIAILWQIETVIFSVLQHPPVHNVLFGQFEFLTTERAETYLKICVLISHLTYICPSSFDCEELVEKNVFVNFKL